MKSSYWMYALVIRVVIGREVALRAEIDFVHVSEERLLAFGQPT